MSILKDPFVKCLALGALIFLVYSFSRSQEIADQERVINVDQLTQDWIYSNFVKQMRRPPTRIEMGTLITTYIENEVKYREALTMRLDDRDSIVRRRMLQKFEFLFGNGAADFVPDDAELQLWYEENAAEFSMPSLLSFSHLWFSPDRRGADAFGDAERALVDAKEGSPPKGDLFPFDTNFVHASPAQIRAVLGDHFATTVYDAPLGEWSGPIESGLGYHLVHVTEKIEALTPPLEKVRDEVLQRWRELESDRILEETIRKLQDEYTVEIDEDAILQFEYLDEPVGAP